MSTFVMMTRLDKAAVRSPAALESLERNAMAVVREKCPSVDWLASYALLGPYDYIDLFEAPDIAEATKVSTLVRTLGYAHTEVWPATDWSAFKSLIRSLSGIRAPPIAQRAEYRMSFAQACDRTGNGASEGATHLDSDFVSRTLEGLDDTVLTAISILKPTYDDLESALVAWAETTNGYDVPALTQKARAVFDILTNNMFWTVDGKASMRGSLP